MQKYVDIIMFPTADPDIRFKMLIKLIEDICSKYPNDFLSYQDGTFTIKNDVDSYKNVYTGGSVIKISSGNYNDEDKYIFNWSQEYHDKRIIQYIFRRINKALSPVQRELLVNRYLKFLANTPKTRDELISQHSLSRKQYDAQMKVIKETLYEILDLDAVDDYGRWMSLSFVQYLREIRTGIKNGYASLHPEWESI